MVDFSAILQHAFAVLLAAVLVTAVIFPLVFIMAFAYDALQERYEKVPKVLLMLIVTFIGVLMALLAIEIYLEFTLPQVISAALG